MNLMNWKPRWWKPGLAPPLRLAWRLPWMLAARGFYLGYCGCVAVVFGWREAKKDWDLFA